MGIGFAVMYPSGSGSSPKDLLRKRRPVRAAALEVKTRTQVLSSTHSKPIGCASKCVAKANRRAVGRLDIGTPVSRRAFPRNVGSCDSAVIIIVTTRIWSGLKQIHSPSISTSAPASSVSSVSSVSSPLFRFQIQNSTNKDNKRRVPSHGGNQVQPKKEAKGTKIFILLVFSAQKYYV